MTPNTPKKPTAPPSRELSRRWVLFLAGLGYLALTLLMFGDVLFSSKNLVISSAGTDGFSQFLAWRQFGFDQLRSGHFPLWNPYVFCGAPYFGGFQAALLYPPNLLYLVLPVTTAMNYSIVVHLFLAGYFVFLWLYYRKLHPMACFVAGMIWMFSGCYFYHIFAGHLPNLCTMIWAPLFFLTLDGLLDKPSRGWCLFGIFVLAMQILAGHPQYLYYTSLLGGLYVLFRLNEAPNKKKTIFLLALIYVGAIGLASLQLVTGAQATAESIRGVGLSSGFAGSLSFPPESFLTLVAPDFFGNMKDLAYWGRWNLWEMCLFCGVGGFLFAVYGALAGYDKRRSVLLLLLLLCCLIALGANIKLFELFYNFVPGFNKFRSPAKFHFLTSLLICLLAGMGLDDIFRRRHSLRPLIWGAAALAVVMVVAGLCIRSSAAAPNGAWESFTKTILLSEQSASPALLGKSEFISRAALSSARSLFIAAGVASIFAIALVCVQFWRRSAFLLVILTTTEMFFFARGTRDFFDANERTTEIKTILTGVPADVRCDFSIGHNLPMLFGKGDIWGNDPGIPLRYAKLMASLQKVDLAFAAEFDVSLYHPFFKALRCRFTETEQDGKPRLVERTNAMPQLSLIGNYRVINIQTNAMKAVSDRRFDPADEVILEEEPNPKPQSGKVNGSAKVTAASTDFLEIEADVESPAILLITDSYTPSWHAKPLPGSSQSQYELLPADYCLRGVPLAAGHHKIRVDYTPSGFVIGKWISIVSLIAYLTALGWYWRSLKVRRVSKMLSKAQNGLEAANH